MFKKYLLLGLLILAPSIVQADAIGALPGILQQPFNDISLASAPGNATFEYALSIGTNGASAITWQTSFSAAPSTVTSIVYGSTDCSTYAQVDTSTSTAGEIRSFFGSFKCLRFAITVVTGGAGKTADVNFVYTTGPLVSQ